jgi:hypothetical protein
MQDDLRNDEEAVMTIGTMFLIGPGILGTIGLS